MITISEEYRLQQAALHANPNYGVASVLFAPMVAQIIKQSNIRSVSDYGAGKQRLRDALITEGITDLEYAAYDPAFPEYGIPQPADLVCCIDVLEHIEPEYLDVVLSELRAITTNLGFLTVHCGPARKSLPDGRNAHLIQQPVGWWQRKLAGFFQLAKPIRLKESDSSTEYGGIFLVRRN